MIIKIESVFTDHNMVEFEIIDANFRENCFKLS